MISEFKIEDIKADGFLHSRVYEFIYEAKNKLFKVNLGFGDLKKGGAVVDCTVTITDWWSLEVYEYNRLETVRHFSLENIPELNQILDFSYNNNELVFSGIGLHNNTAIDYKFTKPKIKITGEYDPE